jgi:predicted ATPase/DNA-binding SARP family transcriptional activator
LRETIGGARRGLSMGEGTHIDFRILGPLEAWRDGAPVALGGAKQRALLARLLLQPGEVVPDDRLIEDLWGEAAPRTAAHTLQVHVSALRKALGPEAIRRESGGYAITADDGRLDSVRFADLVTKARADQPAAASALLREALGLWRGPALADVRYETFAQAAIAQLEEERLLALEERLEADLAVGAGSDLVPELRTLVAEHPLRERLHGHLLLALYRAGRQTEALDVYQSLRQALLEELGVDPSPELQELHRRVLNQDETLSPVVDVAAPTNLPAAATRLVGRSRELGELTHLLLREDVRLVTLTGAGGSGKTRLALEVAAESVDAFPDGVWLVSLAAVSDPELVVPTIASTIGARAELAGHLRDRRMLIVLDNLEQVVEAAAGLAQLLREAPGPTLLVTSRVPLRISAEHEYPVSPLPAEEAVRLFEERAGAVNPEYETDAAVPEICRRLDNLPLALELAAARVKVLSPPALLERLDQRLPLLTGGARDLPQRQQTLAATIEWSWELLTEPERALLARLGVFAGGFTLDAAEEVCGADVDTLGSLVDKSLVRAAMAGRFGMLETIREFARARLEELDDDSVERRHAGFYLARTEQLRRLIRTDAKSAVSAVEPDYDNIRAALAHLDAHGAPEEAVRLLNAISAFWLLQGHANEGFGWSKRLIGRDAVVEVEHMCVLLVEASDFARALGETALATSYAERGLEIARELDDPLLVEKALHELAESVQVTGDYDRAVALYEEERDLALSVGRSGGGAITNLSDVALARGEFERALSLAEEAMTLAGDDPAGEAYVVAAFNRSSALLQLGRLDEAIQPLRDTLDRAADVGYLNVVGWSLIASAAFALSRGSAADGARLLGASEGVRRQAEEILGLSEQRLLAETERELGLGHEDELEEGRRMPLADALELARSALA